MPKALRQARGLRMTSMPRDRQRSRERVARTLVVCQTAPTKADPPLRDRRTGWRQSRMSAVPFMAAMPCVVQECLRTPTKRFAQLDEIPLRRERAGGVASLYGTFAEIMCERRAVGTARIDIPHAIPQGIEPRARPTPIAIAGCHIVQERIEIRSVPRPDSSQDTTPGRTAVSERRVPQVSWQ